MAKYVYNVGYITAQSPSIGAYGSAKALARSELQAQFAADAA